MSTLEEGVETEPGSRITLSRERRQSRARLQWGLARRTLSGSTEDPRSFKASLTFLYSSVPAMVTFTLTEGESGDEVGLRLAMMTDGFRSENMGSSR